MSEIQETLIYKCTDGSVFEIKRQAEDWQKWVDFEKWYEDGGSRTELHNGEHMGRVPAREVYDWLNSHLSWKMKHKPEPEAVERPEA